jgi:hypothetical protein
MDARRRDWQERVEHALITRDAASLGSLYAEAVDLFGADAGQRWARALSAFDASAITG